MFSSGLWVWSAKDGLESRTIPGERVYRCSACPSGLKRDSTVTRLMDQMLQDLGYTIVPC